MHMAAWLLSANTHPMQQAQGPPHTPGQGPVFTAPGQLSREELLDWLLHWSRDRMQAGASVGGFLEGWGLCDSKTANADNNGQMHGTGTEWQGQKYLESWGEIPTFSVKYH